MLDFHSHFLPAVDDGAKGPNVSYGMLSESMAQGTDIICATPHYYPYEESPSEFLRRRARSVAALKEHTDSLRASGVLRDSLPTVYLGAEVYYFPTMSSCAELPSLSVSRSRLLLVEPPMSPWNDSMLDEIVRAGETFSLKPVIAHVDRYALMLGDVSLFGRVKEYGFLIQVNASFFLHRNSRSLALDMLANGDIDFIGTDAHDLEDRVPNLGAACAVIRQSGLSAALDELDGKMKAYFI